MSFSTLPVAKLKQLPGDVTGSKKSSKLALPVVEEAGEHRDAASELDDISFVVPLPKVKVVKRLDPSKGIFAKKGVEDINAKNAVKLEKEDFCFEELQVTKEEHRKDATEGRRGLSEPRGIAVSTSNSSFPSDKISRLDKSEEKSFNEKIPVPASFVEKSLSPGESKEKCLVEESPDQPVVEDEYKLKLYIPEPDIFTIGSSNFKKKLHVDADKNNFSGKTHTQPVSPEFVEIAKLDVIKEFDPGKDISTKKDIGDLFASSFAMLKTDKLFQSLGTYDNLTVVLIVKGIEDDTYAYDPGINKDSYHETVIMLSEPLRLQFFDPGGNFPCNKHTAWSNKHGANIPEWMGYCLPYAKDKSPPDEALSPYVSQFDPGNKPVYTNAQDEYIREQLEETLTLMEIVKLNSHLYFNSRSLKSDKSSPDKPDLSVTQGHCVREQDTVEEKAVKSDLNYKH